MNVKEALHQRCIEIVDDKISTAESAMKIAQESANQEEKSTAGDKHDTARAMSHIERDMYAQQLNEALALKKKLLALDLQSKSERVQTGSLIYTEHETFFIAIGLGKIRFHNADYLVVSPISPIGQQLMNVEKGSRFQFAGKELKIIDLD